jgi:hypothetical protein
MACSFDSCETKVMTSDGMIDTARTYLHVALKQSCRLWNGSKRLQRLRFLNTFVDPLKEFETIARVTDCVIFTTVLVPDPAPRLNEWWYFGLEHGQHVSFYTVESLHRLARRFRFRLVSDGEAFHMFTRGPVPWSKFKRIDNQWWRRWVRRFRQRATLTNRDREMLARQPMHIRSLVRHHKGNSDGYGISPG